MAKGRVVQVIALTAFCSAAGVPAAAQARFELTPFFTSYYAALPMSEDVDNDGSGTHLKQIPGPGIGARLTYWLPSGLGFEAAGSYTSSGVRFYNPEDTILSGLGISLGGRIINATGRVLYRLPRSNFHLLGGAGVLVRGGEFWDAVEWDKLTAVTGVAGFGVRAAVTPRLLLDVKVEGHFYKFTPEDPSTGGDAFPSKVQTDFVVAIGVPLALAR